MRQTVEEAAKEHQNKFEACDGAGTLIGFTNGRHKQSYESFIEGAEWMAQQSPWISVKERLPEPGKVVLLYDKNSIRNYVIGWLRTHKGYNKSMWTMSNGWVEDKDITHWMPIPSFDEILEANKDVLERIKEQGD